MRLSNWSDSVPLSWPEDEGSLPQEEEELVHVCPDEELPGVLHEPGVSRPARGVPNIIANIIKNFRKINNEFTVIPHRNAIFFKVLPLTLTYQLAIEKERDGFNVIYIKSLKT